MDPPRVPVPEELLVVQPVLPEVLPEVEEDPFPILLDEDLVPPDPPGTVMDRDRGHRAPPGYLYLVDRPLPSSRASSPPVCHHSRPVYP